ncbi:MAG: hypothetical protein ACKVJG_19130 [Candidatus Latescibacterota bacterium]|jgi:hypothetical protein
MEVSLRLAGSGDLQAVYEIRRAAILGISSAEFSPAELQAWADKRSPEYFLPMLEQRLLVIAEREGAAIAWGV